MNEWGEWTSRGPGERDYAYDNLQAERDQLIAAIRKHRDQKGDDR
jgi:hypothetical protein